MSPTLCGQRNDWIRRKKKKWISDDTCAVLVPEIREKREAKGKDKNRYQELRAKIQKKLRVDKQQQLEGMCGNRSSKREGKFQTGLSDNQTNDSKVPATPAIQSATAKI